MRRPDWINVEIVPVILCRAIGRVGLAIRSIDSGHLELSAGHRYALTVGHDVRNCQRPPISERGADKKTWIIGYVRGHLDLGGCFGSCWCITSAGSVFGLAQGDRRKADDDVTGVPADMIRTACWGPGAVNADLGCVNDDAFESHAFPDGRIRKFSLDGCLRLGHTLRISQLDNRSC
jgi:hypothetical protein